ncbi:MAG: helix-turn-helix domain-containing protein [Rhodospirillaceae bacterium]|nr:helix-turn-helix domain-containing protein [Rhodospirillaceae bacterium]
MDPSERATQARKGSPFLNTAQAAFYIGITEKTLKKMRARGDGPRFRRHGRAVVYHIDDLDVWSAARSNAANTNHPQTDNANGQYEFDFRQSSPRVLS